MSQCVHMVRVNDTQQRVRGFSINSSQPTKAFAQIWNQPAWICTIAEHLAVFCNKLC